MTGMPLAALAVGEEAEVMYEIIETVEPYMPADKPGIPYGRRHPDNILEAVWRGIDFFDCVMPSRNARHGTLYMGREKSRL